MNNYCPKSDRNCNYALYLSGKFESCCSSIDCNTIKELSLSNLEKDLGKLKKNDTTEIVLRIDDFGGRTGLTIREFVTSEKYTGFTKAGVRIMAPDFKRFKDIINSIPESDMKEEKQKELDSENSEEMPDY